MTRARACQKKKQATRKENSQGVASANAADAKKFTVLNPDVAMRRVAPHMSRSQEFVTQSGPSKTCLWHQVAVQCQQARFCKTEGYYEAQRTISNYDRISSVNPEIMGEDNLTGSSR